MCVIHVYCFDRFEQSLLSHRINYSLLIYWWNWSSCFGRKEKQNLVLHNAVVSSLNYFFLHVIAKLCKTFDVTVVTKCNSEQDLFLTEAHVMFKFRESKHFVRMIGVVLEPRPIMIVLGETVQDTLQNYLRQNEGDIPFMTLTRLVSQVF